MNMQTKKSKIGIIGLGAMGTAFAFRLQQAGYSIIGFDHARQAQEQAQNQHITVVDSIEKLAKEAVTIFILIPAGPAIDTLINTVITIMRPGSTIIDAGNSFFEDSKRRAEVVATREFRYLDCGTSGGLQGRDYGFCLMVGGDQSTYKTLEPLFMVLSCTGGYKYVGPAGAGHYTKMVHNGIEYALLQAYAEGFHLLKEGAYPHLDLVAISDLWNHGSLIRSHILNLITQVLKKEQRLDSISGKIGYTGMGQWAIEQAHKYNVPVKLIEDALAIRIASQKTGGNFATKLVALLRHTFGGHPV